MDPRRRGGQWTPEEFVARTSTRAPHMFGLWPRKGGIHPGADADVVVWDPRPRPLCRCGLNIAGWIIVSTKDFVEGLPRFVLSRGRLVAREGEPVVDAVGWGRQAPRKPPVRPPAKVSSMSMTSSPKGYKMGHVQPLAMYSFTFSRHSSGSPEAEMSWTRSSGTYFMASRTCSGVAGHVSTD